LNELIESDSDTQEVIHSLISKRVL
jgi:hypothetical protein